LECDELTQPSVAPEDFDDDESGDDFDDDIAEEARPGDKGNRHETDRVTIA
jgi:hypothetical protein